MNILNYTYIYIYIYIFNTQLNLKKKKQNKLLYFLPSFLPSFLTTSSSSSLKTLHILIFICISCRNSHYGFFGQSF